MKKPARFKTEDERCDYATKLALKKLESIPIREKEKYGAAQIQSDLEHEILMQLPLSEEMIRLGYKDED